MTIDIAELFARRERERDAPPRVSERQRCLLASNSGTATTVPCDDIKN